MNKRVVVISTSPGWEAILIFWRRNLPGEQRMLGTKWKRSPWQGKSIGFCRGCLACQNTRRCVISDDAGSIVEKMLTADVIAFATPIYYYEMSGQMKTMLDRSNPLFTADYAFRDIYMLSTAAEDGAEVPERAVSGLQGWINCYEQARLAGTVFGGGVNERGEIRQHPEKLREAYEMGRAV